MSEISSTGSSFTTRMVGLHTITPAQPVEVLPPSMETYQILVRRILGRTCPQMFLFIGDTPIPIRGQGDFITFNPPLTERVRLGFLRSFGMTSFIAANKSARNYVELLFVHRSGMFAEIESANPLDIYPIYSQFNQVVGAAGQFPVSWLLNPFDPGAVSPIQEVWGHCRRVWVTSSIDGDVQIYANLQNTPVGATDFAQGTPHVVDTNPEAAGIGTFAGKSASVGAIDAGAPLWRGGVKAGVATPIDIAEDMPAAQVNGKYHALRVFGPLGPSTLTVTYEWHEVEIN